MAIKQPDMFRYMAIFVAISGFFRLAGPHAAQAPKTAEPAKQESASNRRTTNSYEVDLERTVLQSFELETVVDQKVDPNHAWVLPPLEREHIRFVIALLPDPVHTHLGLLFDRGIAAIQLAAQRQGYVFDRAILPWDRVPHQDSDLQKRQGEIEEQRIRESYPGLLIFREGLGRLRGSSDLAASGDSAASSGHTERPREALFVLVVGETPTGGVRGLQFQQALKIAAKIRGTPLPAENPLSILGPNFSGSLVSLNHELELARNQPPYLQHPYVFSGTVTDAESIDWFAHRRSIAAGRFASFQQNDHYVVQRFVDFVCAQRYDIEEIAVLSEDNTVFGADAAQKSDSGRSSAGRQGFACASDQKDPGKASDSKRVINLHFPREISFFRSAYQKATAAQSQQEKSAAGRTTLTLNLEDTGSDDDTVAPYGGTQTPLSQEAVMLSIASELTKHHTKFIVLFATDPVDQLFLARYLRTAYPEGRVIVTVPDLLFSREEDTLLHGVLGLSTYALVPGLGDQLCTQQDEGKGKGGASNIHEHADRLFSSTSTVGVFNAMLGLLALQERDAALPGKSGVATALLDKETLPSTRYVEYAGLRRGKENGCSASFFPLTWLTILGQDGFWPVAPLDADPLTPGDKLDSTLQATQNAAGSPPDDRPNTPDIWYTAYYLCLLLMVMQAVFSWSGSILDDSEWGAQFARNEDNLTAFIIATGALVLFLSFVALMCARSPFLSWKAPFVPWLFTLLLWLPLPLFLAATVWDLARLRKQRAVAKLFVFTALLVSVYLFVFDLPPRSHIYWLPRVVHLSSTVSPVVPFLLLLAGGYWWMCQSLRGVTLVDLRRPRLPEIGDLPTDVYRISDIDADALRETAHPFFFQWQVYIPVLVLIPFAITVVDISHPVQTVEGFAYDAGYSLLLVVMIATFLGCLLKLVRTWFACRHILGGLNRLPLRRAFGRMKGISWQSMWNPGGTTLRETYKLMSRALENLGRLRFVLAGAQIPGPPPATRPAEATLTAPPATPTPQSLDAQIGKTLSLLGCVQTIYSGMNPKEKKSIQYGEIENAAKSGDVKVSPVRDLHRCERKPAEAERILMSGIEVLQKMMAKTAGQLMQGVLEPFWREERSPVVSVGTDVEEGRANHSKKSGDKGENESDSDNSTPPGSLPPVRVLAEEYVALIYVNFLITVLLRIRTMIVCAIGLYVFLVLSVNSYPFEPHPALQTLSVVLIVLLGAAVGYVYSQMHRDPVLSRLTSSEPGELGWDFWLKLGSAAAIPLFSLLATQFPEINQLLTSWLQPALEAVK